MNCDIVRDLLPLYEEGLCSEESRKAVEEHLKSCEACRKLLPENSAETGSPSEGSAAESGVLQGISREWKRQKRRSWRRGILLGFALLLALALLWNAAAAAEAVRRGVTLCLTSVIPALFPFFAVSSLLVSLGAGDAARVLERPFRALFRCGGAGAAAFLLGMIGGYPVGASAVAALVRRGDVSLAEGQPARPLSSAWRV